jgi:spore maturation protein CgeB
MCDRFQRQWFEEGREIAGFSSPDDLRKKVMAYLQCDRERAAIAAAARARAVREHTFKDRFESLFTILGEGGR